MRMIRLRLWHRFFLSFGLLTVVALGVFWWLQQQAFQQGFVGYLNRLEIERVTAASANLAQAYAQRGDWAWLRDRPRLLIDTLQLDGVGRIAGRRPPPGRREDAGFGVGRPLGGRGPAPDRLSLRPIDLPARLALLSNDGTLIVGRASLQQPARVPVRVDGVDVGQLLIEPLPRPSADIDVDFARAQTVNAVLTAAAVLAAVLLVSLGLARWLLQPVLALASATRRLSDGDLTTRVTFDRRDELGELAHSFNHLAQTLQSHRADRQRWGADIAHELRTPLSVLYGEIQALCDGVRSTTPATLASLRSECERLSKLVDDLYQLSLSEAGALDYRFAQIDLRAVLDEAIAAQRQLLAAAHLRLTVDAPNSPLWVRADARRLTQLFANLLINSARYTDDGGAVQVGVRAAGETWVVTVDDSAPGVPPEALPRLFERLFRVETSRNRASGGAGLGLAICQNIVTSHDGTIAAQESPLGGLRVVVILPIARGAG